MATETTKQKALALYIDSVPIRNIAKTIGVAGSTIHDWAHKDNWMKLKQDARTKALQNTPEIHAKVVSQQVDITLLAHKELTNRLKKQEQARQEITKIRAQILLMLKNEQIEKEEFMDLMSSLRAMYADILGNQDLINLTKHGLEVVRPKTQAAFNFIKQENTPTYVFKIEKPQLEVLKDGK